MARQGTMPFQGHGAPASDQSNEASAPGSLPSSTGEDIETGDLTAANQSLETDPRPGISTARSHFKATDGTTRPTTRQVSRSPDTEGDVRADKEEPPAADDKVADQTPATEGNTTSASSKRDDPASPLPSRTDETMPHAAAPRHASSDASPSGVQSASANSQVALSQVALAASPASGMDPTKKPDDRESIALAASATSGAAAPSLPPSPMLHGAAVAQDPQPTAGELLHQTAANLATDGGGVARIVLTPPTLGHVEVRVTMEPSGVAHIAITAATADGYAALIASHSGLLQHLAQRGVAFGSVQTHLQGDPGNNGSSGGGGQKDRNQSAPAAPWVKQSQDDTVIAYA